MLDTGACEGIRQRPFSCARAKGVRNKLELRIRQIEPMDSLLKIYLVRALIPYRRDEPRFDHLHKSRHDSPASQRELRQFRLTSKGIFSRHQIRSKSNHRTLIVPQIGRGQPLILRLIEHFPKRAFEQSEPTLTHAQEHGMAEGFSSRATVQLFTRCASQLRRRFVRWVLLHQLPAHGEIQDEAAQAGDRVGRVGDAVEMGEKRSAFIAPAPPPGSP